MTLQTGVQIYQFVRDRLDDQRDEQHPHGHDAYVAAWRKAHDLTQAHATAIQSGDNTETERVLHELYTMADEWKHHPDYPPAPAVPPAA
ncbi:hypothetical protein G3I57_13025 [Streptomyces albidoflavus]|uniref:hypothetical protein n=1 Tax=Streptomyces albidoflavus TaxID=1886 RepID=UPI0013DA8AB6|nr:hypothetical protein [Streptomyces albidoflavus]